MSAPLPQLLGRLTARLGSGPRLGLDGVRAALELVGNPHHGLRCVHVAGTNGKGSVCAMVESVARAAGLRTGLYTSPHLCRFDERIRLSGVPIDEARFARALELALGPKLPELTFFETLTVAAFSAMREAGVELGVIEVGLGGRLDATNVLPAPLATAIVTIGLDHTELLGHTIASVAREKAGILKPGCPLVLGPLPLEAERAILGVAEQVSCAPVWRVVGAHAPSKTPASLREVRHSLGPEGATCLDGGEHGAVEARVGLAGPHQVHNAAVAAALIWQLGEHFPGLERALARGLAETRWPGRLETIEHNGVRVLLDCAHNPAGVTALRKALGAASEPARTTLLFGAIEDKEWRTMLALLAPLAARRFYTEPLRPIASRRSARPTELAAAVPGTALSDPVAALSAALAQAAPGETLLVTGSIFLVGAVRASLLGLAQDLIVPA